MDLCAARGNTDYVLPCFSIKYSNGGFYQGILYQEALVNIWHH